MGYMVYHAICVTSWDIKILRKTWHKAKEIFKDTHHYVTNITPPSVNGYCSFFIAPDGSKLGWEDSEDGFKARKEFIKYLKEFEPYPPEWALVRYGDDSYNDDLEDSVSLDRDESTYKE